MQYRQITSGRTIRHRRPAATGALGARDRPRARQGALDDLPRGRAQPPQPRRRLPRAHRLRAHAGAAPALAAQQRTSAPRSGRSSSSSSRLDWSPEQVAGWLRLHELLAISHETIYLHVWRDKARRRGALAPPAPGGQEAAQALRRPRLAAAGSPVSATSPSGRRRSRRATVVGHWEIDTVKGDDQARHTRGDPGRARDRLPRDRQARAPHAPPRRRARTHRADRPARRAASRPSPPTTAPSSTATREIEAATGALFYFATPHHSWERGHEREHERADPPVPAEAHEHGARHAGRLRRDRARS